MEPILEAPSARLVVDRIADPWGFWRWRRAIYAVYRIDAAGNRHELLHGEFPNRAAALAAARALLREGAR